MCSSPTWGNHNTIFKDCKYADVIPYRYYDSATRGFDFRGMVEDLEAAKDGAVVVLHGCVQGGVGDGGGSRVGGRGFGRWRWFTGGWKGVG